MEDDYRSERTQSDVLSDWLTDVIEDTTVIDPVDVVNEGLSNAWCFRPAPEEISQMTPAAVAQFLVDVAHAKGKWLSERFLPPMIFYAWHDFQKGMLCLSMVSSVHEKPPFGSIVAIAKDPIVIAEPAVNEDWKGFDRSTFFLQCVDVSDEDDDDDDIEDTFVLNVWVTRIGNRYFTGA